MTSMTGTAKTNPGNFFEDFRIGQLLLHATPRTVTLGDVALYNGLFGARFALQSSDEFARAAGLERSPVDDLLVFHMVFGKTVPDISLNAVANLGYAECVWLQPVFPGDTITTRSKVIGLKENSNRKTGVVYVRSTGRNQRDEPVLDYVRWVMVRKRDEASPAPVAEDEPPPPYESVRAGSSTRAAGLAPVSVPEVRERERGGRRKKQTRRHEKKSCIASQRPRPPRPHSRTHPTTRHDRPWPRRLPHHGLCR